MFKTLNLLFQIVSGRTISGSTDPLCLLRSPEAVAYCDRSFFNGGRSSYDSSYAWSRDQQRLEKIVRLVVAINDRSYDLSWLPTIDHTINCGMLRPIASGVVRCDCGFTLTYH